MTDLATKPDAEGASDPSSSAQTEASTAVLDASAQPPVQWAPAEPAAKKKRRLWLWIGVPVAIVAAGAVAASLVLIADRKSVV